MTEQVDQRQFLGAPSTCGSEFDDIAWTGTVAVHLHDDLHLGVRFNDAGVQAHVAAALGDRVRDHAARRRPTPYASARPDVARRPRCTCSTSAAGRSSARVTSGGCWAGSPGTSARSSSRSTGCSSTPRR